MPRTRKTAVSQSVNYVSGQEYQDLDTIVGVKTRTSEPAKKSGIIGISN